MPTEPQLRTTPKAMYWTGWVMSVLVCLPFLPSAMFKIMQHEEYVIKGFTQMGWPLNTAVPLGIIELACVVLYLIPQTAVLGAILLTGYLGGAISVHVHHSQPFWMPAVMGVLVWLGLYLRDARVRELAPLRKL
ncbi:MAG: DoxX family protein [Pirellulales bacterium]